jgi:hypothetical protein
MAFKVTGQDRQEWAEMRRAWPILAVFFILSASRFIVEHFFGRGWGIVSTFVAAAAWFVIRPWRFGLLPAERRRSICLLGAIPLCGWALLAAFEYWRHHAA